MRTNRVKLKPGYLPETGSPREFFEGEYFSSWTGLDISEVVPSCWEVYEKPANIYYFDSVDLTLFNKDPSDIQIPWVGVHLCITNFFDRLLRIPSTSFPVVTLAGYFRRLTLTPDGDRFALKLVRFHHDICCGPRHRLFYH